MGKQLERFVKAVVGDILKQDYPYLTSPAILLALSLIHILSRRSSNFRTCWRS